MPGPVPAGARSVCSVCRRPYVEHSGAVCAVCGRPVEHHLDAAELELEVLGRARLAEARLAADLEVTEVDEWCIAAAQRIADDSSS